MFYNSSPVNAFSDAAILNMYRSDFFCPSAYKRFETKAEEIDDFYTSRQSKGNSYSIFSPFRYVAQLVYMIGVGTLVSPAGCAYHFAEGWWHRKDNFLQSQEHFKALKKDLKLFGSLVGGVVLTALTPYIGSMRGGFGVALLAYHGWCLINPLVHPMEVIRKIDQNAYKEEFFARWEFNCENGSLPSISHNFLENRVEKLVGVIKKLQSVLPKDHKIHTCQYPVKAAVLDWIEQEKNTLKAKRCWEAVEPLRNDFERISAQLESAIEYQDWYDCKKLKNDIEDAFVIKDGEITVQLYLRQRDSTLGAFSLELFKKLCGSNLFYPSECELIEVPPSNSLNETIKSRNPFQSRRKVIHWKYSKQFCVLVRNVAFLAIAAVGAPLGIIYHAISSAKFSLQYMLQNESEKHSNWERTMAHVFALFVDACFILNGGSQLPAGFFDIDSMSEERAKLMIGCGCTLLGFSVSVIPKISKFPISAIFATAAVGRLLLSAYSASRTPENLISALAYRDERSALFKAIVLRRRCGYVSKGKEILPYNKIIDNKVDSEKGFDYFLLRQWVANGLRTIEIFQQIKGVLPEEKQQDFKDSLDEFITIRRFLNDTHINYSRLIAFLKGCLESSDKPKLSENIHSEEFSAGLILKNKLIYYIDDLIAIENTMNELRGLLEECYLTQQYSIFNKACIFVDSFPFSKDEIFAMLGFKIMPAPQIELPPEWIKFINIERKTIEIAIITSEQLEARSKGVSSSYQELVNRIFKLINNNSRIPSPRAILNLPEGATFEEVSRQYKKIVTLLHPDKVSPANKADAGLFFRIATEAKESCKETPS